MRIAPSQLLFTVLALLSKIQICLNISPIHMERGGGGKGVHFRPSVSLLVILPVYFKPFSLRLEYLNKRKRCYVV